MEPTTDDLLRAMAVLGAPGDPLYIMRDLDDEHRRLALLAHLTAALEAHLAAAEERSDLGVEDLADLHWDADRAAAAPLRRAQVARLARVQHGLWRERGKHADPVTDAALTTLAALTALLERGGAHPMLPDAVTALRDAADHLGTVLRATPEHPV
ncbi:hypothetical protein KZZ52_30505 [Dactylosporangium sp. AC04546]|uniref:hypothetical protein n=1 Tax=Dactylosporangium sp. AC04546 TaxID=2862460 RepID=UPI001EDFE27A|nr:hypothetical protein [Dactylosporangium sp. AC04546]WVK78327.1 hypothetical protein KZZ52_30505 [Dactylosporangium sp. AC04546]